MNNLNLSLEAAIQAIGVPEKLKDQCIQALTK